MNRRRPFGPVWWRRGDTTLGMNVDIVRNEGISNKADYAHGEPYWPWNNSRKAQSYLLKVNGHRTKLESYAEGFRKV